MNKLPDMELHQRALGRIRATMAGKGIKCRAMPQRGCPYDLLFQGGIKVEIKSSQSPVTKHGWSFNICRRQKLSPEKIDFYIFSIPPIPNLGYKSGLYLVIPEKVILGKLTVRISPRCLMAKWSNYINRWDLLKDACLKSKLGNEIPENPISEKSAWVDGAKAQNLQSIYGTASRQFGPLRVKKHRLAHYHAFAKAEARANGEYYLGFTQWVFKNLDKASGYRAGKKRI